jgi:hypothetical protein
MLGIENAGLAMRWKRNGHNSIQADFKFVFAIRASWQFHIGLTTLLSFLRRLVQITAEQTLIMLTTTHSL